MKIAQQIFKKLQEKGFNVDIFRPNNRIPCIKHNGEGNNLSIYPSGKGRCFSNCGSIKQGEMADLLGITIADEGLTLDDFCKYFALPINTLRALGIKETKYKRLPAVEFPINDENGNYIRSYFRTALEGNNFRWDSNNKIKGSVPYGLEYIANAHSVYICEGITDFLTVLLARVGVIPLAVLGASQWENKYATLLKGKVVYAHSEKDEASENLINRLGQDIPDLRIIEFPNTKTDTDVYETVKDASELYLSLGSMATFIDTFSRAMKEAIPFSQFKKKANAKRIAEIESDEGFKKLIDSPDIVKDICKGIRSFPFAGSLNVPFSVYMAITSRLLPKGISIFLEGVSSVGKNHSINSVLDLFPDTSYRKFDGLSEMAFWRAEEDYIGKSIIFSEHDAMPESSKASSMMRTGMDDGKAEYLVTLEEDATGDRPAKSITKHFKNIITTGLFERDSQKATRMLKIPVTKDADDIRQVAMLKMKVATKGKESFDSSSYKLFQEYLELVAPVRIDFDFDEQTLGKLMPESLLMQERFQRLVDFITGFIQCSALINFKRRKQLTAKDGIVLVATLTDYATTYKYLNSMFEVVSSGGFTPLDRSVWETVEDLQNQGIKKISTTLVAKRLKKDPRNLNRNVNKLIKAGKLENHSLSKNVKELTIADAIISAEGLPSLELLTRALKIDNPDLSPEQLKEKLNSPEETTDELTTRNEFNSSDIEPEVKESAPVSSSSHAFTRVGDNYSFMTDG